MSGFDWKGGGHDHYRAINAGIAEGDSFLNAGDAKPIGTIPGSESTHRDEAVSVSVGFADDTDFDLRADMVANNGEVIRHCGEIDFGPGSRVRLHSVILAGL